MSADNGTDVADLDVLAHALDLLAQRLGALDIVGMGDEYRRLLEILAVALEVFDERAVDVALAADLADVDQLADLVAADERLDLQCLAEGRRHGRDPAAAFELVKIVHDEPVRYLMLGGLDIVDQLVHRSALGVFPAGEIDQQTETGGITAGIQRDDLSFGIFLAQLADGDHAGVEGTAQAGGDTGVEHVLAGSEVALKVTLE